MVKIGMMALGICQRKIRITSATITSSSVSVCFRLSMDRRISSRPVVCGDDLHAGRQPGFDLLQLRLHALDHLQRVLALTHDDDARHDLALAVPVGDAAADVRPQRRPRRRRATRTGTPPCCRRQHDVADVLGRLRVAAPAHHVLGAAESTSRPPTSLFPLVRPPPLCIDRDVVAPAAGCGSTLPGTGARSRPAAPPRPRPAPLQVVAQIPVLDERSSARLCLPRRVHQRILKYPAHAGRVRPEFRLHALRQPRQHADSTPACASAPSRCPCLRRK